LRFLYCIYSYTHRIYTNIACSIEAEQRLCSEALAPEV